MKVQRERKQRVESEEQRRVERITQQVGVLTAFTAMKLGSDPMIVLYAVLGIISVFSYERFYLKRWMGTDEADHEKNGTRTQSTRH